ncbi:hypothetical protein DRQ25_00255 [Candidatus Fermentibacteria bacterium]|nr:MAG: hypothetical protein DRQ25_00255 [Candidatus Fermentibacteria bacterium]
MMELRAEILQGRLLEFFNAAAYCGNKIELRMDKGGIGFSQVCVDDRGLGVMDLFSEDFNEYVFISRSGECSVCLSIHPILTALSMVGDDDYVTLKINRHGLWLKSEHMKHSMNLEEDILSRTNHLPSDYVAQVELGINQLRELLSGIRLDDKADNVSFITTPFITKQQVFLISYGEIGGHFLTEVETGFKVLSMGAGVSTKSRYDINDLLHFLEAFPDHDAIIYLGKKDYPLLIEVLLGTGVLKYYLSPTIKEEKNV